MVLVHVPLMLIKLLFLAGNSRASLSSAKHKICVHVSQIIAKRLPSSYAFLQWGITHNIHNIHNSITRIMKKNRLEARTEPPKSSWPTVQQKTECPKNPPNLPENLPVAGMSPRPGERLGAALGAGEAQAAPAGRGSRATWRCDFLVDSENI